MRARAGVSLLSAVGLLAGVMVSGCNLILGGFDFDGRPVGTGGSMGTSCVDAAKDCPATGSECVVAVCEAGKCSTQQLQAPMTGDAPGNCQKRVCDLAGVVKTIADTADIDDDMKPCTTDSCTVDGVVEHKPIGPGGTSPCPGTQICADLDGPNAGNCVACNVATQTTDCPSKICQNNACVPTSCGDTVQNGSETDVDCGGKDCAGCDDGKTCLAPGDCKSSVCTGGQCVAAACDDTVKNGTETDVDCGGSCSTKCTDGKGCGSAADCTSGVCTGGVCQIPACNDSVSNGTETGVDCGGPCMKCGAGQGCSGATDCQSSVCTNGQCDAPTCNDHVKNAAEGDVDCGGPCMTKCADGKTCGGAGDCTSGVCTGGICQVPACNDSVKNSTETDVDCGGSCAAKCAVGQGCGSSADCQSNLCQNSSCMPCTVQVSAGEQHTCARKGTGTLWCWGQWSTNSASMLPTAVLDSSVVEVSAGDHYTCAVKQDGTLWCWGANDHGQLGDSTTAEQLSPVQVMTNVAHVAAGSLHTCAVKQDGTAWCWGWNAQNQLGDGTGMDSDVPVPVGGLGTNVVEVGVGANHTCARKQDGTAWCWGTGTLGQLGDGSGNGYASPIQVTALGSSVVQLSTRNNHNCARKQDGSLWCWGWNTSGEIGIGDMPTTVFSPVQVATLGMSVTDVSANYYDTCAVKQDGTAWCWGWNNNGQLGDGSTTLSSVPVQVGTLGTGALQISAGYSHTCARKLDGTLWCWGVNGNNQLGGASTNYQEPLPVQVPFTCP